MAWRPKSAPDKRSAHFRACLRLFKLRAGSGRFSCIGIRQGSPKACAPSTARKLGAVVVGVGVRRRRVRWLCHRWRGRAATRRLWRHQPSPRRAACAAPRRDGGGGRSRSARRARPGIAPLPHEGSARVEARRARRSSSRRPSSQPPVVAQSMRGERERRAKTERAGRLVGHGPRALPRRSSGRTHPRVRGLSTTQTALESLRGEEVVADVRIEARRKNFELMHMELRLPGRPQTAMAAPPRSWRRSAADSVVCSVASCASRVRLIAQRR